MSNRRDTPLPSEAAARHLAEKGEGAIDDVIAIAELRKLALSVRQVRTAPP